MDQAAEKFFEGQFDNLKDESDPNGGTIVVPTESHMDRVKVRLTGDRKARTSSSCFRSHRAAMNMTMKRKMQWMTRMTVRPQSRTSEREFSTKRPYSVEDFADYDSDEGDHPPLAVGNIDPYAGK